MEEEEEGEMGPGEREEEVRKEGKWVRRGERREGEKDRSVSLTWQVYHSSQ